MIRRRQFSAWPVSCPTGNALAYHCAGKVCILATSCPQAIGFTAVS